MHRVKKQSSIADKESRVTDSVLLSARGLGMSFNGHQVLNEVDLELCAGQVVLLRGPNGSGKTTLINILTGYLAPDKGEICFFTNGVKKNFVFPRRWWHDLELWDQFLPERLAHNGICRSWQETRLFKSLSLVDNVAVSVSKNYAENPLNVLLRPCLSRRTEANIAQWATETLADLGLNGRSTSSGDMISLGQSKRVAIARATGTGARILFLDESLAGLDGPGIESVVNLLRYQVEQHRIALVLVEHLSSVHHLLPLVDTVWDLSEGRLLETSKVETLNDDTWMESNSCLQSLVSGLTFADRNTFPGGATLDIYHNGYRDTTELILTVENLVVRRGPRLVIGFEHSNNAGNFGFNFSLRAGEVAILQAPNGWGKTTLLDAFAGLLPIERGNIQFVGQDITLLPSWERSAQGLRYLRSDRKGFVTLNVGEIHRLTSQNASESLRSALSLRYGQLSGGEKRCVQFHAIQTDQARLLILDEPFTALDGQHVGEIIEVIRALVEKQETAVLVAIPSTGRGNKT